MPITISIPGSKSITNRALLLASLNQSEVILKNAVICDDSSYMIENLQKLGIKIEKNATEIRIEGNEGIFEKKDKITELFCGNAGTTTRFLTALSTLSGNETTIDSDEQMHKRPIKALSDALNQLGGDIQTTNDHLPLLISPQKLTGGKINLPGNISSQFLSALLMICPFAPEDTEINIDQKLYSRPYVEMTIQMLNTFGITLENNNFAQFGVKGNQKAALKNLIYKIESDASSASYVGAYTALHPREEISLKDVHKNSIQGDIKFIEYLEKMGCKIQETSEGINIKGPQTLKSLDETDMNETPDLVMTFAILAVFTQGKTVIKNIASLRVKESDRIKALENEIKKLGVDIKTGQDFIEITGKPELIANPPTENIFIETYNDHRIAMAFGIIKDLIPNMEIENPNCVKKSYPSFWTDLIQLQNG